MAKKRDTSGTLTRRNFVRHGAAAGAGALMAASPAESAETIQWNYEADVVVLGSGCVGLHAAVRARDLGASVIVLEQNFDVGGKLVHSGGWTSLGGGDAIQKRDAAGAAGRPPLSRPSQATECGPEPAKTWRVTKKGMSCSVTFQKSTSRRIRKFS